MKYTPDQLRKQLYLLDEKRDEMGLTLEETMEYNRLVKEISKRKRW